MKSAGTHAIFIFIYAFDHYDSLAVSVLEGVTKTES